MDLEGVEWEALHHPEYHKTGKGAEPRWAQEMVLGRLLGVQQLEVRYIETTVYGFH